MTKHVAVLMGGLSAEREISLRSGEACAKALAERGLSRHALSTWGMTWRMSWPRSSRTWPSTRCTGNSARTACIQGVLELLRIPYTHSGVLASSVAMQKDVAKVVMAAAGVPVPQGPRRASAGGGEGPCAAARPMC